MGKPNNYASGHFSFEEVELMDGRVFDVDVFCRGEIVNLGIGRGECHGKPFNDIRMGVEEYSVDITEARDDHEVVTDPTILRLLKEVLEDREYWRAVILHKLEKGE